MQARCKRLLRIEELQATEKFELKQSVDSSVTSSRKTGHPQSLILNFQCKTIESINFSSFLSKSRYFIPSCIYIKTNY
jgi:hypothetical protein